MERNAEKRTRWALALAAAFLAATLGLAAPAFADEPAQGGGGAPAAGQQPVQQPEPPTAQAPAEEPEPGQEAAPAAEKEAKAEAPAAAPAAKAAPLKVTSVSYADDYQVVFAEGSSSRALKALRVGDDATAIVAAQGLADTVEVTYSDGTKRSVAITGWTVESIEEDLYVLRATLAEQADPETGEAYPEVAIEARPTVFAIPGSEGGGLISAQAAWSEGDFDWGPSYVGTPNYIPPGPPSILTGWCYVYSGFDTDFVVGDFDNGLIADGNFHCADYSAAEPNYMWCQYYAVAYSYSIEGGWVEYSVCVIPDDAATGATNWTQWGECLTGYQRLKGFAWTYYTFNNDLSLQKTSANPGITDGNPNYSLEGAVYDVYADQNCTNLAGTLTTGADGKSNALSLGPGYYYVKERTASKGYRIDATVYTVDLRNGSQVLQVKERPANDPVSFRKLDSNKASSNQGGAQGDATVSGAEYTMEYHSSYDGSGNAVRRWVFRSDSDGFVSYDPSYLISGDALYYDENGHPTLPVGSMVIYESKAPAGYVLNATKYIGRIYQSSGGSAAGFAWVNTNGIITDPVIRGGVTIAKWDAQSNSRAAQGDAKLSATVQVINRSAKSVYVDGAWHAVGAVIKTVTLSAAGLWTSAANWLPYGTYEIRESAAPTGYLHSGTLSRTISIRTNGAIVNMDTDALALKNDPIRGGVTIAKWDAQSNSRAAQGDAGLGATVEIVNRSSGNVYVDGAWRAPGAVVKTVTLPSSGIWTSAANLLPYGTYEIRESAAPTGYLHSGILSRTISIRSNGAVINMDTDALALKNDPIRGGVTIAKWDAQSNSRAAQGDGSLAATVEVVNRSASSIFAEGAWHAAGAVIKTITLSAEGLWTSAANWLPYGTYEVRETEAPAGYLPSGILSRTFEIRAGGTVVNMDTDALALKNDPIRGGVTVGKRDAETGEGRAQGEADLAAVFAVVNRSAHDVIVNGRTYRPGEEVGTITADAATGVATSATDWLPFGTYHVYEKSAPKGYLPGEEGAFLAFQIIEDGETASLTPDGDELVFLNQVIRGGISIEKTLQGGPASDLEGIGFAVYDAEGNRVSWKDADGGDADAIYLDANGMGSTPEGALPYGRYRVEEIAETVPSNVIAFRHSTGAGSDVVGNVNVADHMAMYVIAVVNHLRPEIDIVKIDGDAHLKGERELIAAPSTWVLERLEDGEWVVLQEVETKGGEASFDRSLVDRFGKYRLRETASPRQESDGGWMMPEGAGQSPVMEFDVDEASYSRYAAGAKGYALDDGHELSYGEGGEGRARITATAINWRYRTIGAHKVDLVTGEPVGDTVFNLEVRTESGEWEEVARASTDAGGDVMFDGLTFGTYRLTETVPNPAYMGPEEGGTIGQFTIVANATNGQSQIQVVEDRPIRVKTTVTEATIKKTSVGLVYRDPEGRTVSNVGNEAYKYEVGYTYGDSNTFADEYWIVDSLDMTGEAYGMRVGVVVTPVAANDSDGWFHVLVRTALGISGEDASGMRFTQPELHAQQSLCDGAQRFCTEGWRYLGRYRTSEAHKLVMSELLEKGDHVTALALCYGAVEEGFATESNLAYYITATRELAEGTEIPDSVESHVARNWSGTRITAQGGEGQEPRGLADDAEDAVETAVVGTFDVAPRGGLLNWSSGSWTSGSRSPYAVYGMRALPRTGDEAALALAAALAAMALAAGAMAGALAARRKHGVR